jgi:hypothetical protein
MPEPLDLATNFKASLDEVAVGLGILRPYRELEGAPLRGGRGEGIGRLALAAREDFLSILALRENRKEGLAGAGLPDQLLARMAFNLSDCLWRAGLADEAHGVVRLLGSFLKGDCTLLARALSRFNFILFLLYSGKYPEALDQYKALFALGDRPVIWRLLSEVAFYLCVAGLKESSPGTAEGLYASFVEHRGRFLPYPMARPQETPLARRVAARREAGAAPGPAGGPLGPEDFPLGITAEGQRLLRFFQFDGLDAPAAGDTAPEILARIGTMLTVWHGERRSMGEALARFESIGLWGQGPGAVLERARSATFLTFYLGPDYRTSVGIYERVFAGFEDGMDHEMAAERAKCAINLVFSCGASGDTALAAHYFRALTGMREAREDPLLYAKAALNLITALAAKGEVLEARRVYDSVPDWGSGWEMRMVRLKAVRCLIFYFGKGGQIGEAKSLFRSMARWDGGGELFILRSQAAVFLLEVLEAHQDVPGAREAFGTLRWGAGSPEERVSRVTAARSFCNILLAAGEFQEAVSVYRSLRPWGDNERLDLERARLAVNLILGLGKAGLLRQARFVFSSMDSFARTREIEILRAKGAVNFIAACEAAGEQRRAQAVYDGMAYREGDPAVSREKAKAAVTLVGFLGMLGQPHKGQAVYEAMPPFDDPEYRELKNAAGVNLVTAFAMADRWADALRVATGVVGDGISDELREELLKKLNFIISKTAGYGKRDQHNIMGLFSNN